MRYNERTRVIGIDELTVPLRSGYGVARDDQGHRMHTMCSITSHGCGSDVIMYEMRYESDTAHVTFLVLCEDQVKSATH